MSWGEKRGWEGDKGSRLQGKPLGGSDFFTRHLLSQKSRQPQPVQGHCRTQKNHSLGPKGGK